MSLLGPTGVCIPHSLSRPAPLAAQEADAVLESRPAATPVLLPRWAPLHRHMLQLASSLRYMASSVHEQPNEPGLCADTHLLRRRSRVNVHAPDPSRFPLIARATAQECLLEPGDVVFFPSRWGQCLPRLEQDCGARSGQLWQGLLAAACRTASLGWDGSCRKCAMLGLHR